jgi:hypothetical protein
MNPYSHLWNMGQQLHFREADHRVDASLSVHGVTRVHRMSALLGWLVLRSQAPPSYNGTLRSLLWEAGNRDAAEGVHHSLDVHYTQGMLVTVARKPRTGER